MSDARLVPVPTLSEVRAATCAERAIAQAIRDGVGNRQAAFDPDRYRSGRDASAVFEHEVVAAALAVAHDRLVAGTNDALAAACARSGVEPFTLETIAHGGADADGPDLVIVYRRAGGTWTRPINVKYGKLAGRGRLASLTRLLGTGIAGEVLPLEAVLDRLRRRRCPIPGYTGSWVSKAGRTGRSAPCACSTRCTCTRAAGCASTPRPT